MPSPREGWRRARLETVLDLSLALAGPRREGEVVEELCQRAVGLLDARAGFAASLLPGLEVASFAAVGWPLEKMRLAPLIASPQLAEVRRGGVAGLRGSALDLPLDELLVAACLWQDELVGVVAVADKEAREGRVPFDEEDAVFLRSLALLASPSIASARALAEVERRSQVLEDENRALRASAGGEEGLVGESPAMRRVLELVRRVAAADVSVLVRGESGTGKEKVARLIHSLSARSRGPFLPLNCAAVPETLLEAELFGIEAGVATGVTARVGKLELAHGGTLFLDEVGDLSPVLQAKLLRVVQEREVERVGGRGSVKVDVRLVTATNRDLEAMMEDGLFRRDLYYRLRVVELFLPPLRQRREDIPLLARHFLRLHGARLGRERMTLSRGALELLLRHDYPGNVRELENVLEAAVAMSPSSRVEAEDVRLALGMGEPPPLAGGTTLEEVTRTHVLRVLHAHRDNRAAAARELGIDRSTLYRMLAKWNATPVAKCDAPAKDHTEKRLLHRRRR